MKAGNEGDSRCDQMENSIIRSFHFVALPVFIQSLQNPLDEPFACRFGRRDRIREHFCFECIPNRFENLLNLCRADHVDDRLDNTDDLRGSC